MFLFIIHFILSVAFAQEVSSETQEKTLAIVIGIPNFTNYPTLDDSFVSLEGSLDKKAEATALALQDRADKMVVLNTEKTTTRASIVTAFKERLYDGGYDHVILIWYGWGSKDLKFQTITEEGTIKIVDPARRLFCSDLDMKYDGGDKLYGLDETTFTVEQLELELQKLGKRRTVILDNDRNSGLFQPERGVLYNFMGVTAGDWPATSGTTSVISPFVKANTLGENDFALYLVETLKNISGPITISNLVEDIRSRSERVDENPLPVSLVVGTDISIQALFVGPARVKEVATNELPFSPQVGSDTHATTIVTPPVVIPERNPKKPLWYTTLGMAGACAVGTGITGSQFSNLRGKVVDHPEDFESRETYNNAVERTDMLGDLTVGFGICSGTLAATGTLGLALKW